jgi:hypothetical protein
MRYTMVRTFTPGVILISVVLATFAVSQARVDDDPVKSNLKEAKDEYYKEMGQLRLELLKELDKAEDAARAAGDRALVEQLKADRLAFMQSGRIPDHPVGKAFEKNLIPARQKLEAAYKKAITAYLVVKKDDEAEAVEVEMKAFIAPPSIAKIDSKDSYQAGTIWTGLLRWNADPGSHNYVLVITERTGKKFKGIARLDYGPSGDLKRKSLYDVEGEVVGLNLTFKGDLPGLNNVEAKWVKDGLQVHATAENGGVLTGTLRLKKP